MPVSVGPSVNFGASVSNRNQGVSRIPSIAQPGQGGGSGAAILTEGGVDAITTEGGVALETEAGP